MRGRHEETQLCQCVDTNRSINSYQRRQIIPPDCFKCLRASLCNFQTFPCHRWATVYPEQGTLEPDAGADIRVTASITAGPGGTADMVCTQVGCTRSCSRLILATDVHQSCRGCDTATICVMHALRGGAVWKRCWCCEWRAAMTCSLPCLGRTVPPFSACPSPRWQVCPGDDKFSHSRVCSAVFIITVFWTRRHIVISRLLGLPSFTLLPVSRCTAIRTSIFCILSSKRSI